MLTFRPRPPVPVRVRAPWTVGIEEQVMVVDPERWGLVTDLEAVLSGLPGGLTRTLRADTDVGGCTLELVTRQHAAVGGAIAELGGLRARLTAALGRSGLRALVAGTHPSADWGDAGRCEPAFAMRVGIGVGDLTDQEADPLVQRMRGHLPLLLALSANSPFLRGRETGCASSRIDALADQTAAGARLRPDHGTLEIAVMDAQTRLADVGALAALTQCLVREESTRRPRRAEGSAAAGDLRAAARHGMRALLHDPQDGRARPASELLAGAVEVCASHAAALGCTGELARVGILAARTGEAFQRSLARLRPGEPAGGRRLRRLTGELSAAFIESV